MAKKEVLSEIQITLDVIGGKWKPLILHYLERHGNKRYSEILRYLGSAPKKTLTAQLKELEEARVIKRTVKPTSPVQVEYSVTNHGRSLFPLLDVMCSWGYLNHSGYVVKHPTCPDDDETKKCKEQRLYRLYNEYQDEHLEDWIL